MASITQLLSPAPWPITKYNDPIVQNQEHVLPPITSYQPAHDLVPARNTPSPQHQQEDQSPNQHSEGDDGDEGQSDGRKGYSKRELSTSKRAAQNRAAQRAFRQRKEGYIKKLEEQVREYQVLSEQYKAVQTENYQLRDYIISLQSRLLESQNEVPLPPGNVEGLQPGKPMYPQHHLPRLAEMGNSGDNNGNHAPQSPLDTAEDASAVYPDPNPAKRMKTEATPAQQALQGNAVLGNSPPR